MQVESSWDHLGMEFVTANCATWNSLEKLLALTTAHVVLCQERKLITSEDRRKAEAWCVRNGWAAHFEPGCLGPGGGRPRAFGSWPVLFLVCTFLASVPV
eukprot:3589634-Pyramimonas_sp.AAC.1